MTDLLKKLGDDWHNDHAYMNLIERVVPSSRFALDIEKALYRVREDEHYEFKSLKNHQKPTTIYDDELQGAQTRIQELQQQMEKEEEYFKSLVKKFEEMEKPKEATEDEKEEDEEEEEEEEEDIKANQKKKKGQQVCNRTKKAEELRKVQQEKGIKTSMATSQQKQIDLRDEIDLLERKSEFYVHYQYAARCYTNGLRQATREYSETKDLVTLIKNLDTVICYYEMMMRRYVPTEHCCGDEKALCKVHLLPLYRTRNPVSGYMDIFKCAASP